MWRSKKVTIGDTTPDFLRSKTINTKAMRGYVMERWIRFKDGILDQSKQKAKDYFESSTINCYQYIVDETLEIWERWMWWFVHVCSICLACWIMWITGSGALLTPVAMSRAPSGDDLVTVPHPAVAVCTLNRISKRRATEFAEFLISNKSLDYNVESLVDLFGYLGYAYELEVPAGNQLDILDDILQPYNLDDLLKNLTPTCEDVVKSCRWRNEAVDCSKIFKLRKTMDGYCCAFNYLRQSDTFLSNISETIDGMLMSASGLSKGLSILLDQHLEDYLYTRVPHAGIKVFIFNSGDYPDVPSGGCRQFTSAPRTETYIKLDAVHVTGTPEVELIKPKIRGCIFDSDFDGRVYKDSYSDCVVSCRIRDIRTMCGCVPFFLPSQYKEDVCDLNDVMCLKKWKDNWWQAWSGEEAILENGQIAGEAKGPPCSFCLPPCIEATYTALQHSIPLDPAEINSQPESERAPIKKGIKIVDHSVVHIYFTRDTVVHLIYGVLTNWYDLLSGLGGIAGLVLGGSLISVVELAYFLVGGPASRPRKKRQSQMRHLYWEELRNYKTK